MSRTIDQHPDILTLRAGYERAAESVAVQGTSGLVFLIALYAAGSPLVPQHTGKSRC